nr:PREDICTED: uncharacterized protein LOC107079445 isoform X2 [Lepisosteus oculatus]
MRSVCEVVYEIILLAFSICEVYSDTKVARRDITAIAGTTVSLHCKNESLSHLTQVNWKKDGHLLVSYRPESPPFYKENTTLRFQPSQDKLYGVQIQDVVTSDAGNYSCETTTQLGIWEEFWELLVQGHVETPVPNIAIYVVPSISFAVFGAIVIIFCKKRCRRRQSTRGNEARPFKRKMQRKNEEIYENSLMLKSDLDLAQQQKGCKETCFS